MFALFDTDHSGTISVDEITHMLKTQLGDQINLEEGKAIVKVCRATVDVFIANNCSSICLVFYRTFWVYSLAAAAKAAAAATAAVLGLNQVYWHHHHHHHHHQFIYTTTTIQFIDTNGDGEVDLDEFIAAVAVTKYDKDIDDAGKAS